jgi:hypothetical protein
MEALVFGQGIGGLDRVVELANDDRLLILDEGSDAFSDKVLEDFGDIDRLAIIASFDQ